MKINFLRLANNMPGQMVRSYEMTFSLEITALGILLKSTVSDSMPNLPTAVTLELQLHGSKRLLTLTWNVSGGEYERCGIWV